jgi:CRISPR-associated protein Csx17
VDVLFEAHRKRVLATLAMRRERGECGIPGLRSAFDEGRWVRADDGARFVTGMIDDEKIARLLPGFVLLDWRSSPKLAEPDRGEGGSVVPPPAWAVLAPFFVGVPIELTDGGKVVLDPEPSWIWMLGAERTAEVVSGSMVRLRTARLRPLVADVNALARTMDGKRLAAALLLRLSPRAARSLLERVAMASPESERRLA